MSKDVQNYNYYIRESSGATVEFAKDYFLNRINQRQSDYPDWLWLATVYNLRDNEEYLVISSELVQVMNMPESSRWVVKGGGNAPVTNIDTISDLISKTGIEIPQELEGEIKASVISLFSDIINEVLENQL